MKITIHAAERYIERIRFTRNPMREIEALLIQANAAQLEIAELGGHVKIDVGDCILVCDKHKVITVLSPGMALTKPDGYKPHTGPRSRLCWYCGDIFLSKKDLLRHIEQDHLRP